MEIKKKPNEIFAEYQQGTNYKNSIGNRGIYEQSKMNERFYVGDQWHGVQAGNSRPLVRRNVIKRIGEYKISSICASPVTVNYSADGIPNTNDMAEAQKHVRQDNVLYSGVLGFATSAVMNGPGYVKQGISTAISKWKQNGFKITKKGVQILNVSEAVYSLANSMPEYTTSYSAGKNRLRFKGNQNKRNCREAYYVDFEARNHSFG